MDDSVEFPDHLKTTRQKLGLSQEDLARAVGVSFATINRWESGKSAPSKMGRAAFEGFCNQMKQEGRL